MPLRLHTARIGVQCAHQIGLFFDELQYRGARQHPRYHHICPGEQFGTHRPMHRSSGGRMRMYHVMLSSGVEPSLASSLSSVVVSYVGPDQLLPLASALGASVGVLLLVWHHVVAWGHRAWRLCTKKKGD